MIPAIRQQTIIKLLMENEIVYIESLAERLNISLSTLRRDLKELEKSGEVTLLHGGAVQLNVKNIELNINAKLSLNKEAKSKIAVKACSYVKDNDVIFIDPSSTTLQIIPYLRNKPNITVVTNGIYHANQLASYEVSCIMVGGNIKSSTSSCIGPITESVLNDLNFDKSFLGSNGFSLRAGITNHDINECTIKRIAMQKSKETFFLMDSSKYNVITMTKVASLRDGFIITDKNIPELDEYDNIIIA